MKMSVIQKKIYYHDTDCGGVVYYSNYLKYMEEGRTEYFAGRNISLRDCAAQGLWFVVKQVDITYKAPARYEDTLAISTAVTDVSRASITFSQEIRHNDTVLVHATTTLVCVSPQFKPRAIPDEIRKTLS
ncbi:MAG: YbgC/FadM family acyl-CoA thioesterase [Candidatus Omnitrophica bacterium]|nr:YbgC/FadM family acyl-CoA thioesterase [Candidatus Omnitrophota bacterium]